MAVPERSLRIRRPENDQRAENQELFTVLNILAGRGQKLLIFTSLEGFVTCSMLICIACAIQISIDGKSVHTDELQMIAEKLVKHGFLTETDDMCK